MNAVPKKNIPNFSLSNSNYIYHQTVYLLIFIYPDIKNVYINIVPIMQICMHITVNNWVIATFSKHVFYLYHNNEVIENFLTTTTVKRKSGRQPRDKECCKCISDRNKNEQGKATYFKTYQVTKSLNYKVLRYSLQQKGNLSTQSTQCIIPYNVIYLFNNSVQDAGWIMCR